MIVIIIKTYDVLQHSLTVEKSRPAMHAKERIFVLYFAAFVQDVGLTTWLSSKLLLSVFCPWVEKKTPTTYSHELS
jgi:hypothetical protein